MVKARDQAKTNHLKKNLGHTQKYLVLDFNRLLSLTHIILHYRVSKKMRVKNCSIFSRHPVFKDKQGSVKEAHDNLPLPDSEVSVEDSLSDSLSKLLVGPFSSLIVSLTVASRVLFCLSVVGRRVMEDLKTKTISSTENKSLVSSC